MFASVETGRKSILFSLYRGDFCPDPDIILNKKDLAHTVIAVYEKLTHLCQMPNIPKQLKDNNKTKVYMQDADQALTNKRNDLAINHLNRALCYADKDIIYDMYNKRSMLSQKTKRYEASIVDLDRCLKLVMCYKLEDRLRSRLEQCRKLYEYFTRPKESESFKSDRLTNLFVMRSRNSNIRVASADVGIKSSSIGKTVVASRKIKVGRVVAREPPAVIQNDDEHKYLACSYCCVHITTLIPCPNCTEAMYCDEICMAEAYEDYHEIECQIMHVLSKTSVECRMALKAVLQMLRMSFTWDKFIANSFKYGADRLKDSSVTDAFCNTSPFSLLSFRDERKISTKDIEVTSFECAVVIHYLGNIPRFYPRKTSEKFASMSAVARVMFALAVFKVPTLLSTQVLVNSNTEENTPVKRAWFNFISKLRNDCHSNLVPITLKGEVVLVASKPINRGEELTIPNFGHYLENGMNNEHRDRLSRMLTGASCTCMVCTRPRFAPHSTDVTRELISDKVRKSLYADLKLDNVQSIYKEICELVEFLSSIPSMKEYEMIYRQFRTCHQQFQILKYHQNFVETWDVLEILDSHKNVPKSLTMAECYAEDHMYENFEFSIQSIDSPTNSPESHGAPCRRHRNYNKICVRERLGNQ